MTTVGQDKKPLKEEDEFHKYSYEKLSQMLADDKVSIAKRTRMLWYLRELAKTDPKECINILKNGFKSKSCLLRHEVAYVMGQIGSKEAIPILNSILSTMEEDTMVRHEAGEALGAIGDEQSVAYLKQFLSDPVREVRETCELAIQNIEHQISKKNQSTTTDETLDDFQSVDPAPPQPIDIPTSQIRKDFLDQQLPLFARYRAMFALRNKANKGDIDAINALCEGFADNEGALFKHEVAFVMGQLQRPETAKTLEMVLKNEKEHPMVRHEAAEALGSISDAQYLSVLKDFQQDKVDAVRDSCIVAIDIHKYWTQFGQATENIK